MRFVGFRASLAAGVATAALLPLAPAATAQTRAGSSESEVSEVVITGSRVVRDGSAAPTPVTVLSQEQLQLSAPASYADALNQLPVFQNSLRPSTTGSSATGQAGNGGNYLSLRSLGPNRTLTLLDGRRMPSNASGWTDVNLFPQILVSRIDVVNGGASAAYGSDAVSGVVNFVLDKDFTGLRVNGQYGVSRYSDAKNYRLSAAYGAKLMDDRLRILTSLEHYKNDGVFLDYGGRDWAEAGWGIIPNPTPGAASQIFARDVSTANAANGTLLNGTGTLRDITFDRTGQPVAFRPGAFRSTSVMSGGDGGRARTNLETGVETTAFFGRAAYDVTAETNIFFQVAASRVETRFSTSGGALLFGTIFADNAYLPQSIRDEMARLRVASVPFGRLNYDFRDNALVYNKTDTLSFTGGFETQLTDIWNVSGYVAIGRADQIRTQDRSNVNLANYYRAVDAVRAPNGTIVCRSTLTDPTDGCTPLNIFGVGNGSPQAIDYVTGAATAWQDNEQDVAAIDARGELFQLPAGPVGVAFGLEYRREATSQTVDPVSSSIIRDTNIRGLPPGLRNRPGGFFVTNPQPLAGEFNVKEGYVEIAAPLLKDAPFAKSLDFNAAARYADYSTAGGATTWKVGATWSPVEDVRFRASRSRDVRAPNLAELYTSTQQTVGTQVRDPRQGGLLISVTRQTQGNVNLLPEKADNLTAGVVYRPSWAPGLVASVDYYDVKIRDAIIPPTAQNIVDACARGDTALCDLVIRDATTILTVITPTLNVSELRARGYDIEASYSRDALGGDVFFRALATYVSEYSETSSGLTLERAGELGPTNGVPKWRATLSAGWRKDAFRAQLQGRYIAGGLYNRTFSPAQLSEADNRIESVWYTDLSLTYDLETPLARSAQLFLTINNLLDRDPPVVPTGATTYPRATNGFIYDMIGRYYTMGAKLTF